MMDALTRRILEFVRTNPGGTTANICAAMPSRYTHDDVWRRIVYLQSTYEIENRGGAGRHEDVRWHILEWEPTEFFLEFASDCLREFKTIPPRKQAQFLARRVQQLNEDLEKTP